MFSRALVIKRSFNNTTINLLYNTLSKAILYDKYNKTHWTTIITGTELRKLTDTVNNYKKLNETLELNKKIDIINEILKQEYSDDKLKVLLLDTAKKGENILKFGDLGVNHVVAHEFFDKYVKEFHNKYNGIMLQLRYNCPNYYLIASW